MKIGLVGFYGFNAYSDEFIVKAIQDAFNKEADIEWHVIGLLHKEYYVYPEDLDLIILGGGSLLGSYLPELTLYLAINDTPFVIFGTGVRDLEPEHIKMSRYIWNRASLIGVRGWVSEEKLRDAGFDTSKISVYGDPIFLLEDEHLIKDGYLKGVVRPHNVNVQWVVDCLNIIQGKTPRAIRVLKFASEQGDYGAKLGLLETYNEVCSASFWFGNRLHPFCVALINDIPSIAVEIEFRKVEDVCSTINYPYWIRPDENISDMYDLLMQNWEEERESIKSRIDVVRSDLKDMVKECLTL